MLGEREKEGYNGDGFGVNLPSSINTPYNIYYLVFILKKFSAQGPDIMCICMCGCYLAIFYGE